MENKSARTIQQELNEKATDELIAIWKANDRNQWSEEAFEAIRKIVTERGSTIPEQKAPQPTTALGCPQCQSQRISRHYGAFSVLLSLIILVCFAYIRHILLPLVIEEVLLELLLDIILFCIALFFLIAIISWIGGKTQCKSCGHSWKEINA